MMSQEKQDMLYEEFGSKDDYPCEIGCVICSKTIMYSTSDLTPIQDEVNLVCPKCKEKLP